MLDIAKTFFTLTASIRAARRYSAANSVVCRSRDLFRKAEVVLVGIEC